MPRDWILIPFSLVLLFHYALINIADALLASELCTLFSKAGYRYDIVEGSLDATWKSLPSAHLRNRGTETGVVSVLTDWERLPRAAV